VNLTGQTGFTGFFNLVYPFQKKGQTLNPPSAEGNWTTFDIWDDSDILTSTLWMLDTGCCAFWDVIPFLVNQRLRAEIRSQRAEV